MAQERESWNEEDLLARDAWVRALARRLVYDPGEVDDVVQQAWLETVERPPRGTVPWRRWVVYVVRNLARQRGRRKQRRQRRERVAARPEATEPSDEVVARAESHRRVTGAVLALEEPYRTTILLRYFDRLPPRRVAQRMGVPVATVHTRHRRALQRLRQALDERAGGNGKAWLGALLPVLVSRASAASLAWMGGTLLMGKKVAVVATALLGAIALVWMVTHLGEGPEASPRSQAEPISPRLADRSTNRRTGVAPGEWDDAQSPGSTRDETYHSEVGGKEAQDALPESFRGDVFLHGHVVAPDSLTVPSAMVVCMPHGFSAHTDTQWKWLTRETSDRGYFEFRTLPSASKYTIEVFSTLGYGMVAVSKHDLASEVRIKLERLLYERIEFHGQDGAPIDVSGLFLGLAKRALFRSDTGVVRPEVRRWFRHLGVSLERPRNEAIYIYSGRAVPVSVRAWHRVVRISGFDKVDVPIRKSPWIEWPKVTSSVRLMPTGSGATYRYKVAAPDIEWPATWGERHPALQPSFKVSLGKRTLLLRGHHDSFYAQQPPTFVLYYGMHTRIPYRVEEHDAGILTVHPSIPDLAYAEVTYPTEVSTRPVLVSEPGHSTFLLLTEPGVARAGPLPVGKYWLVLDWDGASPARLASQGKAKRVELQAGFQHVRW